MGINLATRYPGQVDTGDPLYPFGRPKNVVTPGDGTGTPWEKDIPMDLYGFLAALLHSLGQTPSGTPDHRDVSQYLNAIKSLTRRTGICVTVSGATVAEAAAFTLATEFETASSGFVVGTDGFGMYVEAPAVGQYLVSLTMRVLASSGTLNLEAQVQAISSAVALTLGGVRYSSDPFVPYYLGGSRLMQLGGVGERLYVANVLAGGGVLSATYGKLTVVKVSGGASGW